MFPAFQRKVNSQTTLPTVLLHNTFISYTSIKRNAAENNTVSQKSIDSNRLSSACCRDYLNHML
eukprot:TRINITY_DN2355_c0_g1_i1.p4 TRINITY_DN2355_c0_g1~~TRINITY_DN2355_c0_g1_i1.p4  ORF type:complete len:64 (+),score=0.63 TRINITY_DN2355_c0_g1_i1:892-1083(+)